MKSTLKRESKALEIVEIDTFEVSGCFVLGFSCFSLIQAIGFDKLEIQTGDSGLTTVTIKAILHLKSRIKRLGSLWRTEPD